MMAALDGKYEGRQMQPPGNRQTSRESRAYWRGREAERNARPARNENDRSRKHREEQLRVHALARKGRPMIDFRQEGAPSEGERRALRLALDEVYRLDEMYARWAVEDEIEHLHHMRWRAAALRREREAVQLHIRASWVAAANAPEDARHYRGFALVQIERAGTPLPPCLIRIVIGYIPNRP